jgi:hypothetical protein
LREAGLPTGRADDKLAGLMAVSLSEYENRRGALTRRPWIDEEVNAALSWTRPRRNGSNSTARHYPYSVFVNAPTAAAITVGLQLNLNREWMILGHAHVWESAAIALGGIRLPHSNWPIADPSQLLADTSKTKGPRLAKRRILPALRLTFGWHASL